MPRAEPPAWMRTGCPCGDGTTLSGPFDLEEPADMVDRPHFGRVGDEAVQPVPDKGIGIDARPQRLADRDEFFHAVVALAMVDQLAKAVFS